MEQEYWGEHKAPGRSDGAPLYDLTENEIYPDDVYGPRGSEYAYEGRESFYKAMGYRGRPNKTVTIYRAVPKDVRPMRINPGDWVSLSREYAKEHGESLNGYRIISKMVAARDIYTEGNSLDEWGYDPQPPFSTAQEDALRTKLGMETKTAARARIAAAKAEQ